VIVAGERCGMGSSRDWAAKGVALLGVRAVIARSFERIQRTNLVGMGRAAAVPDNVAIADLGIQPATEITVHARRRRSFREPVFHRSHLPRRIWRLGMATGFLKAYGAGCPLVSSVLTPSAPIMTNVFPNRQMKFWEVISGFSNGIESEIVHSVLGAPSWRDRYWEHLLNFDVLVDTQRRDVLDQVVPLELTREICRRSPAKFVLWPTASNLREYLPCSCGYNEQARLPKLTILEVHDRYGPAIIEEIRERGSAYVA
jgi:hypothetical protein